MGTQVNIEKDCYDRIECCKHTFLNFLCFKSEWYLRLIANQQTLQKLWAVVDEYDQQTIFLKILYVSLEKSLKKKLTNSNNNNNAKIVPPFAFFN